MAGAVEKRLREFTAGRSCARRVLTQLGWPDFPIVTGTSREPVWPTGITGSITHCHGYCAAAAARTTEVLSLGIDAELLSSYPENVAAMISSEAERRQAESLLQSNWIGLVFSAKESTYKAWHPLTKCWLDHRDVELIFDMEHSTFTARIDLAPGDDAPFLSSLRGRFAVSGKRIFTAVVVPVETCGSPQSPG